MYTQVLQLGSLVKEAKVSPPNSLGWGKSCFTRPNWKVKVCSGSIFDILIYVKILDTKHFTFLEA